MGWKRPPMSRDTAIKEAIISLAIHLRKVNEEVRLLTELFQQPVDYNIEKDVENSWAHEGQSSVLLIMREIGALAFLMAVINGDDDRLMAIHGIGPATAKRLTSDHSVKIARAVMRRRDHFEATKGG